MLPAQPPLPTAWNFPFQPDAGNHTSILISESVLGVSVAATRQNSGSRANAAAAPPPCAPPVVGSRKAPGGTTAAVVTVVCGNARVASSPHEAAAADAGHHSATARNRHATVRSFMVNHPLSDAEYSGAGEGAIRGRRRNTWPVSLIAPTEESLPCRPFRHLRNSARIGH